MKIKGDKEKVQETHTDSEATSKTGFKTLSMQWSLYLTLLKCPRTRDSVGHEQRENLLLCYCNVILLHSNKMTAINKMTIHNQSSLNPHQSCFLL